MKKILISILIILLAVLTYVACAKGINIGIIKINSIDDIKSASLNLDTTYNKANELVNLTYPNEVETLESAIKKLKTSKAEYENKNLSNEENEALGSIQVKTYTIHYLWTILGNYRKDRKVQSLTLDLKSTQARDVYDLEFTLVGNYVGITDFIYDIENDEELNFEIDNLLISSDINATTSIQTNSQTNNNQLDNNQTNSTNTQNTTTQKQQTTKRGDGTVIQATFSVKNVGIVLE